MTQVEHRPAAGRRRQTAVRQAHEGHFQLGDAGRRNGQRGEVGGRDALIGAQAHQQALDGRFVRRQPLQRSRRPFAPNTGYIVLGRHRGFRGVPAIRQSPAPMRAGPNPRVVFAAPIDEIVARARGGAAGVIGHLVGFEAEARQHRLGRLEERRRQIVRRRREQLSANGAMKGRARLDGQLIRREMLDAHCRDLGESRGPCRRRLSREGIDQVDRDAREMCCRRRDRRPRARAVVVAAEEGQFSVGQGLHAGGDRRFTPASAKPSNRAASVGLASSVTSGSSGLGHNRRAAAMILAASAGGISEGVPPPKNTDTSRRGGRRPA